MKRNTVARRRPPRARQAGRRTTDAWNERIDDELDLARLLAGLHDAGPRRRAPPAAPSRRWPTPRSPSCCTTPSSSS